MRNRVRLSGIFTVTRRPCRSRRSSRRGENTAVARKSLRDVDDARRRSRTAATDAPPSRRAAAEPSPSRCPSRARARSSRLAALEARARRRASSPESCDQAERRCALRAVRDVAIERRERIGVRLAGQREHRLVDDDQRDLGARDRLVVVLDLDLERRVLAGLDERLRERVRIDEARALDVDRQVELGRGRARAAAASLALRAGAGASRPAIDERRGRSATIRRLDRQLDDRRRAWSARRASATITPCRANDTTAVAGSTFERIVELRDVAGLVALLVGHDREVARRRRASTTECRTAPRWRGRARRRSARSRCTRS